MIATTELPSWHARNFTKKKPDVISAKSTLFYAEGTPLFFSGIIGELLRVQRIPLRMEFLLDMEAMICVVRLEFEKGGDGMNAKGEWRALYTYFEVDDFAKLWNMRPEQVHGILGEDISLHLIPSDGEWPVQMGDGIVALFYKADEDKFHLRRTAAYDRETA
jgi:hypothetical protein